MEFKANAAMINTATLAACGHPPSTLFCIRPRIHLALEPCDRISTMESNLNEIRNHRSTANKGTCCVVNVGSRKSKLALIQTNLVIEKLEQFYSNNPDRLATLHKTGCQRDNDIRFEVVSMTTTGDQILDKPLPEIGTKSLFTRELETELIEGRVDFVVHSLKDLPTTLPEGCIIGAVLKRDSPEDTIVLKKSLRHQLNPLDLLCGNNPLPGGKRFRVGTSSLRRIAMIKRCNSALECLDIRGNLNTRISKLDTDDGEYSAIVLAKAGLDRMGWSDRASALLSPETSNGLADWCYAVGQGAIAVECRSNDCRILDGLSPVVDIKTTYEIIAERSLMRRLEGGCSAPLGVRSTWTQDANGEVLNLEAIVLTLDGKDIVRARGNMSLPSHSENESSYVDVDVTKTTGIQFSQAASSHDITRRMISCSELGISVANKMIDSGGLKLIHKLRTREE